MKCNRSTALSVTMVKTIQYHTRHSSMVTRYLKFEWYEKSLFGYPRAVHTVMSTFTFILAMARNLAMNKGPVNRLSCILNKAKSRTYRGMFEVNSPEIVTKSLEKGLVSTVEHMKVPNGTGPDVRKSKSIMPKIKKR